MLPVNETDFWKKRIEDSKGYGDIHHSVYVSRSSLWKDIENAHKKILEKEVDLKHRVLDAGCGYGRCLTWFPHFNYTGVDFSPDFIEIAKRNYPSGRFLQADLKGLPFPDHSFDITFCISIKQMIIGNLGGTEWELIENEIKRVADKVILLEYENPDIYTII